LHVASKISKDGLAGGGEPQQREKDAQAPKSLKFSEPHWKPVSKSSEGIFRQSEF